MLNVSCRRTGLIMLISLVFLIAGRPSVAGAKMLIDPKPPMRWTEMVGCRLVVVAKYESHHEKTLRLRIVRVLKGKKVKPNDVMTVQLKHWYSIETGPTGWQAMCNRKAKGDNLAKLCYKTQMCNPGPLVSVRVIPDVRKEAVYFFPNENKPVLERRGQVQFALFADGWRQAVTGKPMNLLFRILQSVNSPLSRNAVEELYRTRDPKVLAKLVNLAIRPPVKPGTYSNMNHIRIIAPILIKIGDRNGDIYKPLLKLLMAKHDKKHPYALYKAGSLLAQVDSKRALGDLTRIIAQGNEKQKQVAVSSLGYIRNEKAVSLCIKFLEDKELAKPAIWALRSQLFQHRSRPEQVSVWKLKHFAFPRLQKALKSGKISDFHRDQLRKSMKAFLDRHPRVDLKRAGKILLDPKAKVYRQRAEGEAYKLLNAIRIEADVKFVPLLVQILHKIPAAKKGVCTHQAPFTFQTYATLFPNALAKELIATGIKRKRSGESRGENYFISATLWAILGKVSNVNQLDELLAWHGPQWIKKHGLGDAVLKQLKQSLKHCSWRHLYVLSLVDPIAADKLIDKALQKRGNLTPYRRSELLALAIRRGRKELVDELIQTVGKIWEKEKNTDNYCYCESFLLTSRNELAYQAYLKKLDSSSRLKQYRFSSEYHVDYLYVRMLSDLVEEHSADFFKRILSLLQSDSYAKRKLAENQLEILDIDFGYRADDVKPLRLKALARLEPIIRKIAPLSAVKRREALLGLYGIRLKCDPGPACLTSLARTAGHYEPAIARIALDLISDLTGHRNARSIMSHPYYMRERIVIGWLADRELLPHN